VAEVAALVGRRVPRIRIPWYFALPAAVFGEARAYLVGEEPLVTWAGVLLSRHKMFFNSAKAERELEYRARPYTQALRDAVAWFDEHGYLESAPGEALFRADRSAFW
jgi:dihydroflavonol-4-reductase